VQRQEVFEFTQKPVVTIDGDNLTIAFAVKNQGGRLPLIVAPGRLERYYQEP